MSTETMTEDREAGKLHVCPYERVGHIDNWLRPLIHSPKKLFGPHVEPGQTALDVGCGGGFATIGLAKLVGEGGLVIAADLQQEMLDHVSARLARDGLVGRVRTHRCQPDRVGVDDDVDFAVALFMIHEVPDQSAFFSEIFACLRPGGRFFVAEPLFHVDKKGFAAEVARAEAVGFVVTSRPRVLGGRAVVLEKPRS